uniref:Heme-copper oxidase subunit III family profile domain-containing protein n=1 Tax=Phlegmariurus squarrosus TaxID=73615 RepID=H9M8A0_PHLSQ|nr:hypothetical protein HusqMp132 [Phlegmariurus squarrosus]AEV55807.1 hypothetical protein HusqMp132 [Phlegmariurus squarrosus]
MKIGDASHRRKNITSSFGDSHSDVDGLTPIGWRDVIHKFTYEGHHTFVVQLGPRAGCILFIIPGVTYLLASSRAFSTFIWLHGIMIFFYPPIIILIFLLLY